MIWVNPTSTIYPDKIAEIRGTMIGIPALPPPPGICDISKKN